MTELGLAYGVSNDSLNDLLKTEEGFTASNEGGKKNKDQMKQVDQMDTSGRLTVGGAKKKKKTSKKKTAKKKTKKAKKSKRKTMKKKAKKSKK